MNTALQSILARELDRFSSKLKSGSLECSDDEAMNIVEALAHEPMSKESALIHTGFSRSKFDDYCRRGLLPKGRKRIGWKELCWYRDEINRCLLLIKNNNYA